MRLLRAVEMTIVDSTHNENKTSHRRDAALKFHGRQRTESWDSFGFNCNDNKVGQLIKSRSQHDAKFSEHRLNRFADEKVLVHRDPVSFT